MPKILVYSILNTSQCFKSGQRQFLYKAIEGVADENASGISMRLSVRGLEHSKTKDAALVRGP